MSLTALRVALQGLFNLSPVAIAVQGLLTAEPTTPELVQFRPAVIGRGPGTTINYSDFVRRSQRPTAVPMHVSPHSNPANRKRAIKRRQRMEEEVLALLPEI